MDLTWRHDILIDLSEAGKEGRIFVFIQNCIKPKSFKANVNKVLSDTNIQAKGVPQGSVASLTFFKQ